MSDEPKIITDPTPLEIEDLKSGAGFYILEFLRKKVRIPEGGHWIGALGLYKGEKCEAVLLEVYHTVRKALFPKDPWETP